MDEARERSPPFEPYDEGETKACRRQSENLTATCGYKRKAEENDEDLGAPTESEPEHDKFQEETDGNEKPDPLWNPGYDASTESMPPCPVFHPSFKHTKRHIETIFEILREPLEASKYTDRNVEGLKQEIYSSKRPNFPEEVRAGILGDMGTGKSSLLNALLGVGTLARKGDSGQSCTWVVQEFRRPLPGQKAPYMVEVQYYDQRERGDVLQDMFKEAYASVLHAQDGLEQDYFETNLVSQSALQALCALFRNLPEFCSETAAADYIAQSHGNTDEKVIRSLQTWANAVLGEGVKDSNVATIEATTPADLLTKLRRFTANAVDEDEQDSSEPSHWPLIKVIRFGLDTRLLQEGVVLVDIPGLRDINRVRSKTVARALNECTHYLVLANTIRAQDDETLSRYLFNGYQKFGPGRAVAVCTHSDVISDIPMSSAGHGNEQKTLLGLRKMRNELRERKGKLASKLTNMAAMSHLEITTTVNDLNDITKKSQDADMADEKFRIGLRSDKITKVLRRTYQVHTGDERPLPVFRVSNKIYEQYQIGYCSEDRPRISLQATEIPKLRKYLFVETAHGRFSDTEFQMNHRLPSLLASCELWCAKTHMKRKAEIEAFVKEPLQKYGDILTGVFEEMKTHMELKILRRMRAKEGAWNEQAARLCVKWQRANKTSPYLTLCRREGFRRSTKSKPEVSWNRELLAIMAGDLGDAFDGVYDLCAGQERLLIDRLEGMMESMQTKIKNDPQSALMALSPFLKKVDLEKPVLEHWVEQGFAKLKKNISDLKLVTVTDCDGSIISECMKPIYQEVSAIAGSGCGALRPSKMEQRISTVDGLWTSVHNKTRRIFMSILNERHDRIKHNVAKVFEGIHRGFNSLCEDKPVEDVEEKKLREELRTSIDRAWGVLQGPVTKAMEDCKKWA